MERRKGLEDFFNCILVAIALSSGLAAQSDKSEKLDAETFEQVNNVPKSCKQLVWVKAQADTSLMAEVFLLKRSKGKWEKETLGMWMLGRNGLADGCDTVRYLNKLTKNCKVEGDGKTPKGLYPIGTAFGYTAKPKTLKLKYQTADSLLYCIDDASYTKGYNKIIRKKAGAPKTWNSSEEMKRKDICYQLGLEIKYNHKGVAGRGSCIFIHIRKPGFHYTAGCIAGNREQVEQLLFSLKRKFKPMVLITAGQ